MTYTYKLARRLAISRESGMFASLLLLAACADDATGPGSGSAPPHAVAVRVVPGAVTIETDQKIRFRGEYHTGARFASQLDWHASGGTIESDGTFTATEPGVYKIVGRGRGRQKSDTSTVVVVPRQPKLVAVQVSPDQVALNAGATQTFTVVGRLSDSSEAAIGVTWAATGGTIDEAGSFKAGSVSGTFQVIATHASRPLADTAQVEVIAPEAPPPTLSSVILKPAQVSLTPGSTRQFTAYGKNSLGDSVSVTVTFSATGGSVTSGGLYTAGTAAGTYRVVARHSELADTAVVTLTAEAPMTGRIGVPFGPSQQLARTGSVTSPFTMSMDAYSPSNIVNRIQAARSGGYTLLLALPGGSHDRFMSEIDGVYQFDGEKWRAAMDGYNTSTIRQAVAAAVTDGIIVAANIMDEPYVSGGATGGGNTWGPKGTMTKARVDSLCGYVKAIFPTLPAGPEHQHHLFEPDKSYRVCDFYIDQYAHRFGDVTAFRDAGLQMAARDGHGVMFAMNILDGGVQDRDGTYDCAGTGQAGKGTYSPNCRMTAQQVREWGILLGSAGCGGLYMWRYDDAFATDPANQQAFRDLAAKLSTLPVRSCLRN